MYATDNRTLRQEQKPFDHAPTYTYSQLQVREPNSRSNFPIEKEIFSRKSTGAPKVILNLAPSLWIPQHSEPFLSSWTPVVQLQTTGTRTDASHQRLLHPPHL